MSRYKVLVLGLLVFFSFSFIANKKEKQQNTVLVKIDFGSSKEIKETRINWKNNLTALEALQYTSVVETYSANQYVIVTSIDGVRGERGVMAWYYEVNGEPAKKLAINNVINSGDTITWIYKTDVCSKTVDK